MLVYWTIASCNTISESVAPCLRISCTRITSTVRIEEEHDTKRQDRPPSRNARMSVSKELTPEERLEEWVAAYFLAKTGREGTSHELAELAREIPPETREKLEAMHKEATASIEKSTEFVQKTRERASGSWSQAWLMIAGAFLGMLLQMDTIEEKVDETKSTSSSIASRVSLLERFGLDRSRRGDVLAEKTAMLLLVLSGTGFAWFRYRRLVHRPFRPRTIVEYRMFFCLFVNLIFIMRFLAMLLLVYRSVPWWEALMTGAGMLVIQPLFMGLCALDVVMSSREKNHSKRNESRSGQSEIVGENAETEDKNDRHARESAKVWVDLFCVVISLAGAALSTIAEWQRHTYLQNSQGSLYTGGLFAYARHINYTGEVLLFLGWSMITRSPLALLVPCFFYATFSSLYVPDLDLHLHKKYGVEFEHYMESTPSLLPFMH